jgi:hypothetical protein
MPRCGILRSVAAHDPGAHVTFTAASASHIDQSDRQGHRARPRAVYDANEYRAFGQSVAEDVSRLYRLPVDDGSPTSELLQERSRGPPGVGDSG